MGMVFRPKRFTKNQKSIYYYTKEVMKDNIWYYRDRLNIARGPCDINTLRKCWISGLIDENTLMWGHGLDEWLPAKNIKTIINQIRTIEVQLSTFVKRELVIKPNINQIRELNNYKRNCWIDFINNLY